MSPPGKSPGPVLQPLRRTSTIDTPASQVVLRSLRMRQDARARGLRSFLSTLASPGAQAAILA